MYFFISIKYYIHKKTYKLVTFVYSLSGVAMVELAILLAGLVVSFILLFSLFQSIKEADKQTQYSYTLQSIPNPNTYQLGFEGQLVVLPQGKLQLEASDIYNQIKFGTDGGESCVKVFIENEQGNIENISETGICNCDDQKYYPEIQILWSNQDRSERIAYLAYMSSVNQSDQDCDIYKIFIGSTQKTLKPKLISDFDEDFPTPTPT